MVEVARQARSTSSKEGADKQRELCLGITLNTEYARFPKYDIYLGFRGIFEGFGPNRPVKIKRIPNVWESELYGYYMKYGAFREKSLGWIEYKILQNDHSKTAITDGYWPRKWLGIGVARKLPYFIEAITTQDLRLNKGITHISTTNSPDHTREEQLKQVELPINKQVEIREWLSGLGRGIRNCMVQLGHILRTDQTECK